MWYLKKDFLVVGMMILKFLMRIMSSIGIPLYSESKYSFFFFFIKIK
jgi:hypothetical protein